jgi:hypothetical protein
MTPQQRRVLLHRSSLKTITCQPLRQARLASFSATELAVGTRDFLRRRRFRLVDGALATRDGVPSEINQDRSLGSLLAGSLAVIRFYGYADCSLIAPSGSQEQNTASCQKIPRRRTEPAEPPKAIFGTGGVKHPVESVASKMRFDVRQTRPSRRLASYGSVRDAHLAFVRRPGRVIGRRAGRCLKLAIRLFTTGRTPLLGGVVGE